MGWPSASCPRSIIHARTAVQLGTRFAELLATVHARLGSQFKLTVERPAAAFGDLGSIGIGGREGLAVVTVSLDGRP